MDVDLMFFFYIYSVLFQTLIKNPLKASLTELFSRKQLIDENPLTIFTKKAPS